jgi:SAM-dependent methyltransferase
MLRRVSSFSGDIADHYASFRRGFALSALDLVVARLGVGPDDLVVDLGCGTGQLALPLSSRVRHVLDAHAAMSLSQLEAGNGPFSDPNTISRSWWRVRSMCSRIALAAASGSLSRTAL